MLLRSVGLTLLLVMLPGTLAAQKIAVFNTLDKITANVGQVSIFVGQSADIFGNLSVFVGTCHKTPPEETPEVTAFVQMTTVRKEKKEMLFSGWMFASSPGLNPFEHPVYDIWLVDCVEAGF